MLKPEARTLHSSGAVSQEAAFQLTPMADLVTEGLFPFEMSSQVAGQARSHYIAEEDTELLSLVPQSQALSA